MTNEGTATSIKDVKPGQKNLTLMFIVLDIGKICCFPFSSIVVTLGCITFTGHNPVQLDCNIICNGCCTVYIYLCAWCQRA